MASKPFKRGDKVGYRTVGRGGEMAVRYGTVLRTRKTNFVEVKDDETRVTYAVRPGKLAMVQS